MSNRKKSLSVDISPKSNKSSKFTSESTNRISDEKLEDLMKEWSRVKRQISELEDREKSIKELVNDIMKEENVDSLYTDNYKVTRKIQKRYTVSQRDLPEDIWKKYSKKSEFPVLYLKRV